MLRSQEVNQEGEKSPNNDKRKRSDAKVTEILWLTRFVGESRTDCQTMIRGTPSYHRLMFPACCQNVRQKTTMSKASDNNSIGSANLE
jgi:hypothetical protein